MTTIRLKKFLILLQLTIITASIQSALGKQPNIIFIMADDMGWNDVGFHGSGQIPTPNIDALAYSGLILNNYYVTAICTPSRSALMTGKHPIHTGMQHTVLFGAEPRGLPLSERLLPQHLRGLGYATRIVGKWHLGSYKRVYTPTERGFDSHLGFWTGHQDYFDHTAVENPSWGLDMRRGLETAWDLHGKYSTDVFTNEAVRLIQTHNTSVPLFLYVAHAAVHSGNPYNPLPAPDDAVERASHVKDYKRRRFTAMMMKLDDSVGEIVNALRNQKMLEDSIIVFTTDNGGPAAGFNLNAASNWPLRGVKNTLWEGGVRGAALLWSPMISERQRVADQLMHITDWLPTLYTAAGGNFSSLGEIDGIDVWDALSKNTESKRDSVLHNIDDIYGNAAITVGEWKLLKGTTYNGAWDGWYGPSGREDVYNIENVMNSKAGRAVTSVGCGFTAQEALSMRANANVQCTKPKEMNLCHLLKAPCLFNIRNDPCELNNLANELPGIVKHLEQSLAEWNATAIPPGNLPLDPRGDPRFWDHTWTNFGDYSILKNAVN